MYMANIAEHRVRMPAPSAHAAGTSKAPEKWLNRFARLVALIERVGNALGTLAFTWATVVLLGGYAKDLHSYDDFWFATAIAFLEAIRMFTRNNRLDYQVFFNTRGAFRPLDRNGLIGIVCFFDVSVILLKKNSVSYMWLALMATILTAGRFLSGLKLRICNLLRRATSLWSPLVAIILLAPSISDPHHQYMYDQHQKDPWIRWTVFTALLVSVLLVTVSRLRFTGITKLVDSTLGRNQVFCRGLIINICMTATLGMQVVMLCQVVRFSVVIIIQVYALAVESFGNFQIPAAGVRILLALLRLKPLTNTTDYDHNLVASLKIFYGMVLGQGILYAVACMLEFFSFIPRRCLVHCGGFRGYSGVESVNLYYAYALEKCMKEGVLAPKKISLSTFAMDSVNSDSSKNQLYGIRMMDNFLQSEPTKAQLLSKLATSTKTMDRIIKMLDWTSAKDTAIRLYAAKVIAELAKNLRVVTIPGTVQLVSALLDTNSTLKRGNPLLDTDDEHEERHGPVLTTEDSQGAADNQLQRQEQLRDNQDLLETQPSPTQQVGINKQNSCWQRISELWSIPKEQLLTDHDLLPVLAMSIINSLAGCDQDNCVEITKAGDLIPKIIGFTSYRSDMFYTQAQQKVLLKSSLKVLQRLTSIGGEIGITLRYKISRHTFLLSNLSCILRDDKSSQISRNLVAGILRNIAVDEKARQDIGRFQMIITKLMQTFLNEEGTMSSNANHLSRKVAGQALAMLTSESAQNCMVLLKEPDFIKKLKHMILIHDGKYIYVAASVLRNLCLHRQPELTDSDMKELSHTLREVLERILKADGAELEILIGLSSQICRAIPEEFIRELDNGQIKQEFLKTLVDTLKAHMEPSAYCPGIRRVILEQFIHLMECNSRYADSFKEISITELLSTVEQTPSEAENYRLFLGDKGFMKYSMPLSDLVARAKELLGCE